MVEKQLWTSEMFFFMFNCTFVSVHDCFLSLHICCLCRVHSCYSCAFKYTCAWNSDCEWASYYACTECGRCCVCVIRCHRCVIQCQVALQYPPGREPPGLRWSGKFSFNHSLTRATSTTQTCHYNLAHFQQAPWRGNGGEGWGGGGGRGQDGKAAVGFWGYYCTWKDWGGVSSTGWRMC